MLSEFQKLEDQIELLQNQLSNLPDGRLICSRNQGRYKWYQSKGGTRNYISKENRSLAAQLALKKYLSLQLEEFQEERKALQYYLKHHCSHSGKAEELLSLDSEYKELLSEFFTPLNQELEEWMHAPYQHNSSHPEQLIHKSISGNFVRSKSESIIDMFLYLHKIPFRYECALRFDGLTVYPDFTIRHPKTGKKYYWEHFGLMDNQDYSQKACSKLHFYTSNGIIPSVNLITTYESKENPLSPDLTKKIIQYYFL